MATQSVTIRLPIELLEKCDATAVRRKTSRTWVVIKALEYAYRPRPKPEPRADQKLET